MHCIAAEYFLPWRHPSRFLFASGLEIYSCSVVLLRISGEMFGERKLLLGNARCVSNFLELAVFLRTIQSFGSCVFVVLTWCHILYSWLVNFVQMFYRCLAAHLQSVNLIWFDFVSVLQRRGGHRVFKIFWKIYLDFLSLQSNAVKMRPRLF